MRQPPPPGDVIDLFDEVSEAATERELAWMWLADLESRVDELEALTGVPFSPLRARHPALTGSRVADLEDLAECLPSLYELSRRAPLRGQGPLW